MPTRVTDREHIRLLMDDGAQLVEVLPREEYESEHIAGALHIWLRKLDTEAPQRLDQSKATIVYCHDFLCDMSPRAALRLEHLGFTDVYDYVPGKVDWMAAGLAREGKSARVAYAGDLANPDVPSCPLSDVLDKAEQALAKHGFCVADDNTVMGMIYADDVRDRGSDVTIERVMHPGPTTVRANEPVEPLVQRMRRADVDAILVTDPEGRLIGLFDRHTAEPATATATQHPVRTPRIDG